MSLEEIKERTKTLLERYNTDLPFGHFNMSHNLETSEGILLTLAYLSKRGMNTNFVFNKDDIAIQRSIDTFKEYCAGLVELNEMYNNYITQGYEIIEVSWDQETKVAQFCVTK